MLINNFRTFIAQQLGLPSGWFGKLLVHFLNKNNAPMNDIVLKLLDLQSGDRLLEVGFGGGYLLQQITSTGLPTLTVGIERSSDALEVCQQRFQSLINQGTIELYLADAIALPFPDRYFTQVCTVNTIYFWPQPLQVLTECYRVLSPGGKLITSYKSKDFLEKNNFSQYDFLGYEIEEVEFILKATGFIDIKTVSNRHNDNQGYFCTYGRKIFSSNNLK